MNFVMTMMTRRHEPARGVVPGTGYTMKTTTISTGIEWVVVTPVNVLSLHRSRDAAERSAKRLDGYVVAAPTPRHPDFALRVGDRCRIDNGMVLPR